MKLLPFPEPRQHLRRRSTSRGRPEIYFDHSTRVLRWMDRNALRRITEVRKISGRYPTVDELQAWLVDHCVRALDYFAHKFEKMTEEAAVFALSAYDDAEYDAIVRRAKNGGRKSRRGKTYTIDQLRQVDGLSIAKQATALGCSTATIKRLRDELKAEIQAQDPTNMLIAQLEAEITNHAPREHDETETLASEFDYLLDPDAVAPPEVVVETVALPVPIDIRTRRPVDLHTRKAV